MGIQRISGRLFSKRAGELKHHFYEKKYHDDMLFCFLSAKDAIGNYAPEPQWSKPALDDLLDIGRSACINCNISNFTAILNEGSQWNTKDNFVRRDTILQHSYMGYNIPRFLPNPTFR